MHSENNIIQQVYAAKENIRAADRLIEAYLPFIKAETAKFLRRPPVEGQDDALSIAMIAFHEGICSYSHSRGSFLKYAALLIKSRLIDYYRKEQRHSNLISLDSPNKETESPLSESIADSENHSEKRMLRDATQQEIAELSRQMQEFQICLSDVADNCPKQQRTMEACRKALQYAKQEPQILEDMLRTKRLPISQITAGSGVERKTLERHRKYILALLLIHTNGYEILREHIKQVLKGGPAK
ncbi:MAG: sigma-70 family RNA polymerase sigma factor [Bacillota bacterium]|nr:sigma-70 family RNA polymerase sigma factor [Bacillota bacterium]